MNDKLVCVHVWHMIWQADHVFFLCVFKATSELARHFLICFPKPVKHKHRSADGSKDFIGHVTHSANCLQNGEGGLCRTNVGFSKLISFFYTIECFYIMQ